VILSILVDEYRWKLRHQVQPGSAYAVKLDEIDEDAPDEHLRSTLLGFLRGPFEVPSLPRVAVELSRLANEAKPDFQEALRLVVRDVGLAGRVIRAASSPLHGNTKVTDLRKAAVLIGIAGMRDVAFAMYMGAVFRCGRLDGRMRLEVRNSFQAGCLMQSICLIQKLDSPLGFLCGLMHDVGNIVILAALAVLGRRNAGWLSTTLAERLQRLIHVEAGLIVASNWDLPAAVRDVIKHHHEPENAGAVKPLADAVAVADLALELSAKNEQDFVQKMSRQSTMWKAGLTGEDLPGLYKELRAAARDARFMTLHR